MIEFIQLTMFVISFLTLIVWCSKVYKSKVKRFLFLRLTKNEILLFFFLEILLFAILYGTYLYDKSNGGNDDGFAWEYLIVYGRGVMISALFSETLNNIFNMRDPIYLSFVFHVMFDYIILYVVSKIGDYFG